MARNGEYAEPVGAITYPDQTVELVLETDQGPVRVVMTWKGWTTALLMLTACRCEVRGIQVQSMQTGEIVSFMNDPHMAAYRPEGVDL